MSLCVKGCRKRLSISNCSQLLSESPGNSEKVRQWPNLMDFLPEKSSCQTGRFLTRTVRQNPLELSNEGRFSQPGVRVHN